MLRSCPAGRVSRFNGTPLPFNGRAPVGRADKIFPTVLTTGAIVSVPVEVDGTVDKTFPTVLRTGSSNSEVGSPEVGSPEVGTVDKTPPTVLRTGSSNPMVGSPVLVDGTVDKTPPTVLRTGSSNPVVGRPIGILVGFELVETEASIVGRPSGRVVVYDGIEPTVEPTVPTVPTVEPRVEVAVPSKFEAVEPTKLVAVGTAPLKRFEPVEVVAPKAFDKVEVAPPKRFDPVEATPPTVLRRAFGSTVAAVLRSVEPAEPTVPATGPLERLSGMLLTRFNGAFNKELTPEFKLRPDKRPDPASAERPAEP